jgi:prevent-host-death family protein
MPSFAERCWALLQQKGKKRARKTAWVSGTICVTGCVAGRLAVADRALATKRYRRYTLRIMSRRITQRELRNDSAAVLRDVQAGETVTVTRNGTPIAELRPVSPRRFVPRAAIANARARALRVDFGRLRSDLDAVASPFVDE